MIVLSPFKLIYCSGMSPQTKHWRISWRSSTGACTPGAHIRLTDHAPTPQRRLTDAPGCAGASGGSGRQIGLPVLIGASPLLPLRGNSPRLQSGEGAWIVCTCRHMSADTFLFYIAGPCARPIGKLANIGD